jgi:hypothetical protein
VPEKSVTQNFMEETIGLRTIISENETDRDGDRTLENSICAFDSPNRVPLSRVSDGHRLSAEGGSWVGSRRDVGGGAGGGESMAEAKRGGEKRGSKLNVSQGISDIEARDIKKFLKGVGVHTKRVGGQHHNDTRWENVSFGLRGLLKKMDDKIIGIKNNLGI